MSTIRKRTQEDVIDYIKNHASEGKLQESLMDIANSLGYSNATIHRVLKSLEQDGVIAVLPPDKPTKPNTIVYNGPIQQAEDIITEGAVLLTEVERLGARVAEYVQEASRIIEGLKEHSGEKTGNLEARVTEVVDMPDGKHYMMIVKKEHEHEAEQMRHAMRDKQLETQMQ